jgi:AraC-like DNA-binding protein
MNGAILTQLFEALPFDKASAILSELRSPWGFALCGQHFASFHATLEGSWELHIPPLSPMLMRAGDVAFLPTDRPHDVRDRSTTGLVSLADVPPAFEVVGENVKLLRHSGHGARTRVLTMFIPIDLPWRTTVLGALPPLLHVPGDAEKPAPALAPFVHRLNQELQLRRPGYLAASTRLIELLILEMLRMKVDDGEIDADILSTAADPGINATLIAMHKEVDRTHTVSELAKLAGMSRSLFAARFAALVGVTPHQYLVRLRLQQAAQLLRSRELTVFEVATSVGYQSESSFSRVFTREMGLRPAAYRKLHAEGGNAPREDDARRLPPEDEPSPDRPSGLHGQRAAAYRQGIG